MPHASKEKIDAPIKAFATLGSGLLRALAVLAVAVAPALAQEPRIIVELNKLEPSDSGCQAWLVVDNGLAEAFDALVLDLVVFDPDGIIARRMAVDVAPVRAERMSVKAFPIQALDCDRVGRMLVNGVLGCSSGAGDRGDCLDLIEARSRAGVDLVD